jgi:hypothetical protein
MQGLPIGEKDIIDAADMISAYALPINAVTGRPEMPLASQRLTLREGRL